MSPRISVIMPAYNAERYLREAIDSVLQQTSSNVELICVNDGSTDGTGNILRSYGDRIIFVDREVNAGIGVARNVGIERATGEFLAFMDADDVWKLDKLSLQMEFLQSHPQIDICFTHMQCFVSPDLSEEEKQKRHCPTEPMAGYLAASSLMSARTFARVGLFDPRWRVGEFIDWMSRAKDVRLTTGLLPDVLLLRRIHGTNTGITERPALKDYARIAREALERRKRLASS